MASTTSRLALIRHTLSDVFRIQDYTDNWNTLDSYPGIFVCTSGTRPATWGAPQAGQAIYETDTKLIWHWDGAAFERVLPKGEIGYEEVVGDISTAATTYQTAVTVNVTVADGDRPHHIIAQGPGVFNPNGVTLLAIYRGGTLLQEWKEQGVGGAAAADQPRPLSMVTRDTPVAGAESYTLQYKADAAIGGTSTLQAGANKPLALSVVEM